MREALQLMARVVSCHEVGDEVDEAGVHGVWFCCWDSFGSFVSAGELGVLILEENGWERRDLD